MARRLISATGQVVRLQWFVKNVAPAMSEGDPSMPPGVSVRLGSPDDTALLAPLVPGREALAWRFGRGDIVLIAELEGEVVGCTWLTCRPLRPSYLPILVSPGQDEWYNYGLVLRNPHRGRGLGRALSRMAMREVGRRGGKQIFGHAARFNRVAAASHAAAGFVAVEELLGLTVLGRFVVVLYRRTHAPRAEERIRLT